MKTCNCCGETMPMRAFTHSSHGHGYAKHCKECGVWLRLLRQAFGPARHMDRVRASQVEYERKKRLANRSATVAGIALQNVWR